jgi:superfamily II DNA/RNA helicase
VRAEHGDVSPDTEHVDQFAYRAHSMDKPELLARILQARGRGLTMIFVRTKRAAAKIADDLLERGFAAAAVHGDLGQGAREQALRAFRSGKVDVLVATDVAARGLDVEGVTHVINYQAPEDEKTYIHRIGRTARAGASGTAITLIDWDELPRWRLVCDALGLPFHEPVETYSTSPHLRLELDIPAEAGATLPHAQRTRSGLAAEAMEELGGPDARRRRRTATKPERASATATRVGRAEPAKPRRQRRRTRGGVSAAGVAGSEAEPRPSARREAKAGGPAGSALTAAPSNPTGDGFGELRNPGRGELGEPGNLGQHELGEPRHLGQAEVGGLASGGAGVDVEARPEGSAPVDVPGDAGTQAAARTTGNTDPVGRSRRRRQRGRTSGAAAPDGGAGG